MNEKLPEATPQPPPRPHRSQKNELMDTKYIKYLKLRYIDRLINCGDKALKNHEYLSAREIYASYAIFDETNDIKRLEEESTQIIKKFCEHARSLCEKKGISENYNRFDSDTTYIRCYFGLLVERYNDTVRAAEDFTKILEKYPETTNLPIKIIHEIRDGLEHMEDIFEQASDCFYKVRDAVENLNKKIKIPLTSPALGSWYDSMQAIVDKEVDKGEAVLIDNEISYFY